MDESINVYESEHSIKIVHVIYINQLSKKFQLMIKNKEINHVYYENGKLILEDIWNNKHII